MKNNVSYKDLSDVINDFRRENNERFDRIEKIFEKHCDEQSKLVEKYTCERNEKYKEIDNRFKPLEKLADRALFGILLVSGIFAALWQLLVGWIKKEFNI